MSEFKPIMTQAELDRIMKDRLRRERRRIIKLLLKVVLDLQEVITDLDRDIRQ